MDEGLNQNHVPVKGLRYRRSVENLQPGAVVIGDVFCAGGSAEGFAEADLVRLDPPLPAHRIVNAEVPHRLHNLRLDPLAPEACLDGSAGARHRGDDGSFPMDVELKGLQVRCQLLCRVWQSRQKLELGAFHSLWQVIYKLPHRDSGEAMVVNV